MSRWVLPLSFNDPQGMSATAVSASLPILIETYDTSAGVISGMFFTGAFARTISMIILGSEYLQYTSTST